MCSTPPHSEVCFNIFANTVGTILPARKLGFYQYLHAAFMKWKIFVIKILQLLGLLQAAVTERRRSQLVMNYPSTVTIYTMSLLHYYSMQRPATEWLCIKQNGYA